MPICEPSSESTTQLVGLWKNWSNDRKNNFERRNLDLQCQSVTLGRGLWDRRCRVIFSIDCLLWFESSFCLAGCTGHWHWGRQYLLLDFLFALWVVLGWLIYWTGRRGFYADRMEVRRGMIGLCSVFIAWIDGPVEQLQSSCIGPLNDRPLKTMALRSSTPQTTSRSAYVSL